jgi:hypothetical protein
MEELINEMSNYKGEGQVKVIAFITRPDDCKKSPVPETYMSGEGVVPPALIEELKSVGWSDGDGNIWFPEGFCPVPVRGDDGDVYLAVGSDTMKNEVRRNRVMTDALSLLNGGA